MKFADFLEMMEAAASDRAAEHRVIYAQIAGSSEIAHPLAGMMLYGRTVVLCGNSLYYIMTSAQKDGDSRYTKFKPMGNITLKALRKLAAKADQVVAALTLDDCTAIADKFNSLELIEGGCGSLEMEVELYKHAPEAKEAAKASDVAAPADAAAVQADETAQDSSCCISAKAPAKLLGRTIQVTYSVSELADRLARPVCGFMPC